MKNQKTYNRPVIVINGFFANRRGITIPPTKTTSRDNTRINLVKPNNTTIELKSNQFAYLDEVIEKVIAGEIEYPTNEYKVEKYDYDIHDLVKITPQKIHSRKEIKEILAELNSRPRAESFGAICIVGREANTNNGKCKNFTIILNNGYKFTYTMIRGQRGGTIELFTPYKDGYTKYNHAQHFAQKYVAADRSNVNFVKMILTELSAMEEKLIEWENQSKLAKLVG